MSLLAAGLCRAAAAAAARPARAAAAAAAAARWPQPLHAAGGAVEAPLLVGRQARGFLSAGAALRPALAGWPRLAAVALPSPAGGADACTPAACHAGHALARGPLAEGRRWITRNIRGRLFYKRRPKWIPIYKFNRRSKWLEGTGFRKGVCTKVFVMAPRKPNSGLRKVAYVRLSNGRIIKARITGIGHNLQVHSVVMIRGGPAADTDGCNYTCMRGKYDLLPVKNRLSRRSKYAVSRPATLKSNRERFKFVQTSVDRRLYFYKTGIQVGDGEPVPQRIKAPLIKNNPNATYRHNWKKVARK